MTARRSIFAGVLVVAVAIALAVSLWSTRRAAEPAVPAAQPVEAGDALQSPVVYPQPGGDATAFVPAPGVHEAPETRVEPVEVPLYTTMRLEGLLSWALAYKDSDPSIGFYQDSTTIGGRKVTRVRARKEWDNEYASFQEVEIFDMGRADKNVLTSLGFDTESTADDDWSDLLKLPSEITVICEYDADETGVLGEGSCMLLVGNRFLVEVRIEALPFTSYQWVIDHHLPLRELIEMAAE